MNWRTPIGPPSRSLPPETEKGICGARDCPGGDRGTPPAWLWRQASDYLRSLSRAIARTPAGCRTLLQTTRRRPDPRAQRPTGTTILSDLGARVIKIEPPGDGDDTRTFGPFYKGQSLYFSFVNRGKESIVLNLKEETDRAIFLNMVRQADILTENFRPGVMDRL